jgi:Family of unknown function (DUF6325)
MSADLEQVPDVHEMGPIAYLVLAFPTDRMTGEAFPLLIDLVDRGIIRILDLAFIRKEHDGTVTTLTQVDVERMQVLEAALFDGAASGLLGPDDLAEAATAMDPGSAAGVLVYENVWATPFARALRRSGGQLVASGHIPVQELVAALDSLEDAESGGQEGAPSPVIPAQGATRATPAGRAG